MQTVVGIARYESRDAKAKLALMIDGQLFDLVEARRAGTKIPESWLTGNTVDVLVEWRRQPAECKAAIDSAEKLAREGKLKPLGEGASVIAPFKPNRIFCAAANYVEHANEMGTVLAAKANSKPYVFLKLSNTVIGPGEDIGLPPEVSKLDWEIELAAVIGEAGRRISTDRALDHVAGYSIVNDISARDLNVRGDYPFKFDWFQGKCHDTFAPFGPCIVPSWSIADPQAVEMCLTVNDKEMQKDSTRNMIWSVREQIAYLSTIVTLEPGDVIATGTPTGVGMAHGIYLKAGDVVSASITGIGTLTNTVVTEAISK